MFFSLNKLKLLFDINNFVDINICFSSEKNITYMQILQNPNDLDLNLKYAQQQGKDGKLQTNNLNT